MLNSLPLDRILFLDIETVPQYAGFDQLSDRAKKLWEKKASHLAKNDESADELYERAGIYAEFGKIVCISAGVFSFQKRKRQFRLKSFFGTDEHKILSDFAALCNKLESLGEFLLCAHNGKEFDFPYIARRTLIQGLPLPKVLDIAGKKPWEIKHLDTLELWKFGDYKSYTSLDLLMEAFNIPSPKDDIDGSQVGGVYWKEKDVQRIARYCEKDVLAIAQLFLKYRCEPVLAAEEIESTSDLK